jgi:hypothetical protein
MNRGVSILLFGGRFCGDRLRGARLRCSQLRCSQTGGVQLPSRMVRILRASLALTTLLLMSVGVLAQQPPEGPMAPPSEHRVERIGNTSDPGEPPTLPIDQVIKKLAQQEDLYFTARSHYTYRKTIRIQEFGPDGKPSGEYVLVTQPGRDPGWRCNRQGG